MILPSSITTQTTTDISLELKTSGLCQTVGSVLITCDNTELRNAIEAYVSRAIVAYNKKEIK